MQKKGKRCLTLFLNMLYISACTFGGGFVIVSLMKKRFCDKMDWLPEERMLDLTSIAQSSPGAIAVNAAVLLGYDCAGMAGSIAAMLGTVIPPLVILSLISLCYDAFASSAVVATVLRGMQAGVAAVVFDVSCGLGEKIVQKKNLFNIAIMVLAFLLACVLKVNVIYVILGGIAVGVLRLFLDKRRNAV